MCFFYMVPACRARGHGQYPSIDKKEKINKKEKLRENKKKNLTNISETILEKANC